MNLEHAEQYHMSSATSYSKRNSTGAAVPESYRKLHMLTKHMNMERIKNNMKRAEDKNLFATDFKIFW